MTRLWCSGPSQGDCSSMQNGRYSYCPCVFRIATAMFALALPASWAFLPGCRGADGDKPPKADSILDKYVEVTGGKAAYSRIRNRLIKVEAEYLGENVRMVITRYEAPPSKRYVRTVTDPFGTVEDGTDGEVVWSISPLSGPRIKEGQQRDWDLRRAFFHPDLHWRKLYRQAKCLGIEPINEKPCYKIVVTPHVGAAETRYYDTESYLLSKKEITITRPGATGEEFYETFVEDYREVDGVLIPHKMTRTKDGEQPLAYVITSIQHNAEIPEYRFDLPEKIKTLLEEGQKQEDREETKTEAKDE